MHMYALCMWHSEMYVFLLKLISVHSKHCDKQSTESVFKFISCMFVCVARLVEYLVSTMTGASFSKC